MRHALIALTVSLAAACGGHSHTGSYARAETKEQGCCENLTGPARDQCLGQLPTVDKSVADDPHNAATYACVEDHFVCDPSTGTASKESAQAQYDCVADLGQ